MRVCRAERGLEQLQLDGGGLTLSELEEWILQDGASWVVATSGRNPDGSGHLALVLPGRSIALGKDDVDDLIVALADYRVALWGPDLEL
jgi:hypothetical protein